MKKILLVLSIFLLFFANAKEIKVFDFSKQGDKQASEILKDYIQNYTLTFCPQATGFFYDIDEDNKKEIIGYVHMGSFYNLKGYKFIVLKEASNDKGNKNVIEIGNKKWYMEESNVFFEPDFPVEIKGNRIIYHQGDFYKNKKRSATFKTNVIDAGHDLEGYSAHKVKNLEDVLQFSTGSKQNKLNIEDFKVKEQKKYDIKYNNIDPKIKKYLEMR